MRARTGLQARAPGFAGRHASMKQAANRENSGQWVSFDLGEFAGDRAGLGGITRLTSWRFSALRPYDLPAPVAPFICVSKPVTCPRISLSLHNDFDLYPVPEQRHVIVQSDINRRIEFHD